MRQLLQHRGRAGVGLAHQLAGVVQHLLERLDRLLDLRAADRLIERAHQMGDVAADLGERDFVELGGDVGQRGHDVVEPAGLARHDDDLVLELQRRGLGVRDVLQRDDLGAGDDAAAVEHGAQAQRHHLAGHQDGVELLGVADAEDAFGLDLIGDADPGVAGDRVQLELHVGDVADLDAEDLDSGAAVQPAHRGVEIGDEGDAGAKAGGVGLGFVGVEVEAGVIRAFGGTLGVLRGAEGDAARDQRLHRFEL